MKQRLLGLALPLAGALALGAAVLAALDEVRWAGVAGALALAAGLLGAHLRLDALDARVRGVRAEVARGDKKLGASVARTTDVVRRQAGAVRRDLQGTRKHLDMLPSDTAYLQRLLAEVAPGSAPLPALGGWAATSRSVLAIIDEIQRAEGPLTIVDCGSGASTLLDALVLRSRGRGGKVFALDADPVFAEETRGYLRDHGVSDFGAVVDAPIVDVQLPDGTTTPWYDLAGLADVAEIDVLFVDGPIGTIAEQARYPAFPLLAQRLTPGALVVLDDTNRPEERAIVRRWLAESHAGRSLELIRVHGRATLLRVT
jgi:predicted O-methyltransferase YrrM